MIAILDTEGRGTRRIKSQMQGGLSNRNWPETLMNGNAYTNLANKIDVQKEGDQHFKSVGLPVCNHKIAFKSKKSLPRTSTKISEGNCEVCDIESGIVCRRNISTDENGWKLAFKMCIYGEE